MAEYVRHAVILVIVVIILGIIYDLPLSMFIWKAEQERCGEPWIRRTVSGLKEDLEKRVHGQHIAVKSVYAMVAGHLKAPKKNPLTMAFFGLTGVGKNYLSDIVAEHMYKYGTKSKYVHKWSGAKEFQDNDDPVKINTYKSQITEWVTSNITACPYQLFIFDEEHLMPDGLLDVLQPYLSPGDVQDDGVDYSEAIYIILSNKGGSLIKDKTADTAEPREKLSFVDFDQPLRENIKDGEGGLKDSKLIGSELINAYIPFLPLERKHARQCAYDSLHNAGYNSLTVGVKMEQYAEKLLSQRTFTNVNGKEFADKGCKNMDQTVFVAVED